MSTNSYEIAAEYIDEGQYGPIYSSAVTVETCTTTDSIWFKQGLDDDCHEISDVVYMTTRQFKELYEKIKHIL